MRFFRSTGFQIAGVMLLAAAWKILFIFWEVVPFNADEAVVALMARHILQGDRPVFFYGQAYMGSLDAFLAAAGFGMFGYKIWVIRLVQMLLYLGTVLTTIYIGKEAFGSLKAGLIGALLLAVPTVNMTLYTTASLGGYGEALFIGNLILLVSLVIVRRYARAGTDQLPWPWFLLLGVLIGGGLWANGLTLVYSAPAGIYLLWMLAIYRSRWIVPFLALAAAGFFIGALPWWLYALSNGPDRLLLELFGTAVAVEKDPWIVRTANHLVNFLLLGLPAVFGMRPPWAVRWLGLPLLPIAFIFWLAVIGFFFTQLSRKSPDRSSYAFLGGVGAALLAGFLFTPFGVDPSGRYFLPLAVPLALVAAQMILAVARRLWHVAGLVGLVLVYQAIGTIQCALTFPPGLTTQFYEPTIIDHRADGDLIDFLRQEGETRGYSNYWVAYPLAFHSSEELIFIPRLPYHLDLRYTPRDDRYAPYGQLVEESERVAYITTRNPQLDQYLQDQFEQLGVSWQEKQIGDYHIYYRLSKVVSPQDIGLGELRE